MRRSARRLLATILVLLASAAVSIAGPSRAAQAAPADCGYPAAACACPTLSVSTTAPRPGERIAVSGADFAASSRVTLVLAPSRASDGKRTYVLRSLRTGSDGGFDTSVTMPASAIGAFDIRAVDGAAENAETAAVISCPADPTTALTILGVENGGSTPDSQGSTAFTGFNALWLLLLAAALVAVGVYANRRGRGSEVRSIHG